MKHSALLTLIVAAAITAACDSPSGSGDDNRPARLDIVSGDLQSDTVGREVASPLVVRVLDEDGDPVSGQIVNFVVTAGGGSVFAGAAQTNANGEARERWTLGPVAGDTQRVEVRAVDPSTGQPLVFATFRAVGLADAPDSIIVVRAAPDAAPASSTLTDSLEVRVVDRFDNPVPGATVQWSVTAGGGSVSPATSQTRADGTARTAWTLGSAQGANTATAQVGTLSQPFATSGGVGAVTTATVLPAGAFELEYGDSLDVEVDGRDAYGNRWITGWTWSSSNSTVLRLVSEAGLTARFVAVRAGTAEVRAAVSGQPTFAIAHKAAQVETLHWSVISAGAFKTCGLTTDGVAYCWGRIHGLPVTTAQRVPTTLRFKDISVAAGTCAISTANRLYCWDFSSGFGLLAPPGTWVNSPTLVASVPSVTRVEGDSGYEASPRGFVCAWTPGGTAYCSGDFYGSGPRGFVASGPAAVSEVSAGGRHACAISATGETYCWGAYEVGQTGSYVTCDRLDPVSCFTATPKQVATDPGYTHLASGANASCALTSAGEAFCWGGGAIGYSGAPPPIDSPTCPNPQVCTYQPFSVLPAVRFTSIDAWEGGACGLDTDGGITCWGNAPGGGPTGVTITRLVVGAGHACALLPDATARCWGSNSDGQLGDGTQTDSGTPVTP